MWSTTGLVWIFFHLVFSLPLQSNETSESDPNDPGSGDSGFPVTSFSCIGKYDGFYADTDTGCKVFHYCQTFTFPDNTTELKDWPFACPLTTTFQQQYLTCSPPNDQFRCEDSEQFYPKPGNTTEAPKQKPTERPLLDDLQVTSSKPEDMETTVAPILTEDSVISVPVEPGSQSFLLPPYDFSGNFEELQHRVDPLLVHPSLPALHQNYLLPPAILIHPTPILNLQRLYKKVVDNMIHVPNTEILVPSPTNELNTTLHDSQTSNGTISNLHTEAPLLENAKEDKELNYSKAAGEPLRKSPIEYGDLTRNQTEWSKIFSPSTFDQLYSIFNGFYRF